MPRWILSVLGFSLLVFLGTAAALAQPAEEPPYLSERRERALWWEQYAEGRALLLEEHYGEAALVFAELQKSATTIDQKRLALELEMIARALEGEHQALRPDQLRTGDELSLLYSTAFIYGFGTSAWLALQTEPEHFAGAVLPFAVLTTASVGGVALADGYRPLGRGVPQAISAGFYLGFVESVWVVGTQHSVATRRGYGHWNSARVSTVLWSGATAGAITGALVGDTLRPEPGSISFVTSSALWGGIVAGLAGAGLQPGTDRRGETAFIAAGAGFNLGLGAGLFFVPKEPPSVARVRVTDVSGLGGALIASGAYAAFAGEESNRRVGFGAAALGAGIGLGLGWWLTDGMTSTKPKKNPIGNVSFTPVFMPTPDGFSIGLVGSL